MYLPDQEECVAIEIALSLVQGEMKKKRMKGVKKFL